MTITQNINNWLATGERGISSESILSHLTGINFSGRWGLGHPLDPSDLMRCHLLLEAAPELYAEFHRMAEVSPQWKKLTEEWKPLVDLMLQEAKDNNGRCSKAYERMKELGC